MKKAKIILCMLLALAMMFTLFACNKTSSSGTSPAASSAAPSSAAPSSAAPSSAAPSAAASAKPSAAASAAPSAAPAIKKPSTITIGCSGWLGRFLDGAQPAQNITACSAVYDQLFVIDIATKKPFSRILADWKYVDDLTFTMTLKPNITFTNGDKATADDLLFSITNHIDRKNINVGWLGPLDLPNCKSDGNLTVTLKWTKPWGPGIYGTTMYLYDKAWCLKTGWDSQDWYGNPNGTGPYKVTEYVTDDHMTLVLKDNYWNAANQKFDVQKWIIKYYPDGTTMDMALEKGDIAACAIGNTADYKRMKSSKDVGIMQSFTGDVMNFYVGPTCNPVFKDINVRKAIAYGVDWAAIGKLSSEDRFVQATSMLTSTGPYYKNVGAYPFDLEKAKQALKDGGYKAGDIKIHDYEMNSDASRTLAEAFQFYCQEMGITVNLEFGDVTSALVLWMKDGGSDVGWMASVFGVPDCEPHKSISNIYIKGFVWQLTDDQKLLDMLNQALYNVKQAERIKLYQDAQQYAHDNFLVFPLGESQATVGYKNAIFTADEMAKYTYSGANMDLQGLSASAK